MVLGSSQVHTTEAREALHDLRPGETWDRFSSFVLDTNEEVQAHLDQHGQRIETLNLDSYDGRLSPEVMERILERDELELDHLRRGLVSKYLMTAANTGHDEFAELQTNHLRLGEQIRVRPSIPHRMVIMDRDIAVIGRPHREPGGIVITSQPVIDSLVEAFHHLWDMGRPFQQIAAVNELRLSVRDLLFDGCTDETIARRLHVSPRTVSRVVAALMQEHECQTRFQLGAALARLSDEPVRGVA